MANLVMGAMSSIIPKLGELLKEEYDLQTSVKGRIKSLTLELELAQAALCKVAEVPWDQLDKQVQIWARNVREASYDMEDVLDTFLVRVKGPDSTEEKQSLQKHLKKVTNFFKKSKARRKISGDVTDIMSHLQEVTKRCRRYKVEDIGTSTATMSAIDPRLAAMYTHVNKLVGMDKSSGDLVSMVQTNPQRGDVSTKKMKIVSIVGVGGLGKTTLAKVVYDKIKWDFSCTAFVSVGRNPDLKKIFKDILIDLDKKKYLQFTTAALDERQLIDELRKFFREKKKRYLIIVDDIWEVESWETIKLAMDDDNNFGGRIVITTRNTEVARTADEIYKLQPLCYDSSRELLFTRISGEQGKYVHNQPYEILDKFIRKCSGIPLAIITMASLLAGKQREEWSELYNTIDFGSTDNKEAENTMRILSFSYYDLPAHLRACLLYLSAFPEDSVIDKGSLVWKWVAEGFVREKNGTRLFELGEGYFNDLINRSMIQSVESDDDDNIIIGCRVHDVILDFIRSMSREECFFTVLDNNQDTLSNIRRLANHNKTIIGHTHQIHHVEMAKLRSFTAIGCVIETWAPLSSFTLLRVLAIENCKPRDGSYVRVEHLGHLHHLRFLSLGGTRIGRVPKEIGALRFLQTLNLWGSEISEFPSNCSLPKQLACLRVTLPGDAVDCKMFSVEGMASLQELTILARGREARRRLVKELGSLRELRVLSASISYDEETERDVVESLRQLHKLQSIKIYGDSSSGDEPWQATELDLPRHLRYLDVDGIYFCKLPSCINPSRLPNLSHLDLLLHHMDEQDLKNLGRLPELCFLGLELLSSSATISNISDSDAFYFPKLTCCRLPWSMVLFVGNKEDKIVSFHIWNGVDGIGIMPFDSEYELERPKPSVSSPLPFISDNELPRRLIQKLQHVMTAVVYYLVVVVQLVLALVKRWWISNSDSTPASPFMQSLQVLQFVVRGFATVDHRYCDNLGLEYLTSLRKINVDLQCVHRDNMEAVEAALRRAAQAHPNRPTLHIRRF